MSAFVQACLVVALYNLALLGGTAYLVAVHDWSGWWFLPAGMLCKAVSDCDCKDDEA